MTQPQHIALIAGAGALPAALLSVNPAIRAYAPAGLTVAVPAEPFHFERLIPFLDQLVDDGFTHVVMGGAMQRPRLDPAMFDPATAQMVPRLLAAMQAGDDATLREVIAIIEEAGLAILAADEIAPDLVPGEGVLTALQPSEADRLDAARATHIVAALGAVDVGQGAVVAQGLCLAVESQPGTDLMLDWVADVAGALRRDPNGAKGVLYKSPKPGQDLRVDLPALGIETVRRAAKAGLAGICWQAGGVMLLEREAMIAEAEALGLFLWARAA